MSLLNPDFKYTDAEDTKKPGYLKRKFDQVRRELRETEENAQRNAAEAQAKVAKIGKK